jgi:hypothetical protein
MRQKRVRSTPPYPYLPMDFNTIQNASSVDQRADNGVIQLLPDATSTSRLAQENRFRNHPVSLQQSGAEYADAGLESQGILPSPLPLRLH